ncbi:MAG TPA: FAD-binding oxidoreductase [Streptosporangiaceae bacterium]|nr:FAD-binding oxidoreductase [Streptosporangiaceae bacterium]
MDQNDQFQQPVQRSPRTSRREFLVGAGAAGLVAAGAAVAPSDVAGTRPPATSPPHGERALPAPQVRLISATAKPTSADWAALARRLSTRKLLRPGEKGYRQAKQLFEPRFDGLQPAGVAYCASAADVAACLSFVRRFRLPVRVRSGGHSYAGWSSVTGGLVVDVSAIHLIATGNSTIRVGSGTDLIHFYSELSARGLAVPGGSCPTVGIAGLALGGGVGVLSRLYGLTCDNMTAVQIVTADGSVLECDQKRNSDLYWACRGGGGGNFGVATSFTFAAHHLTELCVFYLSWPWSRAAQVVGAWQSWAPHAPDALWSTLHLSADFGGKPVLSVSGTYAGAQSDLAAHLDDLSGRVSAKPSLTSVSRQSYLDAMLLEAGCPTIPLRSCHTGPGGQLSRVPAFAKSDLFTKPLSRRGIRALLSGIEKVSAIRGADNGGGSIAFDALGGAVNRVHPAATAFVHRDALFLAQYYTSWNWPGTRRGVANQHRWLRSYYNSMHPHASGQAYQNYIDPGLSDWQHAYYGANYARLTRVKAKYDPGNMFSFPQSIGSA